jgi:hypothetical protein
MKNFSIIILFVCSLVLLGCKGGNPGAQTSTLTIKLTDAPFPLDVLESAVINISKIDMNHNGKFVNLITANMSYDLLNLRGGLTETLTQVPILPGTISQLRIFVEDATVTLKDGRSFNLKVPSGSSSGLKLMLNPSITVVTGTLSYELTLDFDISKSFKPLGNPKSANGITGFNFTPTIRVANNTTHGRITGTLFTNNCTADTTDDLPLDLFSVEALKDSTSIAVGGTDSEGKFALIGLEAGTYQVKVEDANHNIYSANYEVFPGNETKTGQILLQGKCVTIGGTVYSNNNTANTNDDVPFSGADVDLYDSEGAIISSVSTDASGNFTLPSLFLGNYEVVVNGANHIEKSTSILETASGAQNLLITLEEVP